MKNIILTLILLLSCISPICAQNNANGLKSPLERLYELPPFERAVRCIKFYEGLHRRKDYPYVGYGHKLRRGDCLSSDMSEQEAERLLRKDLSQLCRFFRNYGKDSLLLATLAYNIGPYKILGNKRHDKSTLIKKIESGIRDFHTDYIVFCRWKGRYIKSIERRRVAELLLLYIP